jgi:hypothetical protein
MLVLALVKSIEIIGVAGGDVVPVEKRWSTWRRCVWRESAETVPACECGKIALAEPGPGQEQFMHAIRKKIVTDEDSRPIAVQIDYEDWLEIERLLGDQEEKTSPSEVRQDDFEAVADELAGSWKGGDGLAYQIRIREEWDDK